MVLPEIGEIVCKEISLAAQRRRALGVIDLHFIGVEVQHQAEIVPDVWCEGSFPQGLLWARGAGAEEEEGLCVFFRRGVAAVGGSGADGELIGGKVLVLDPDQLVLVAVVQWPRMVGSQTEVESLDSGDAVCRVGWFGEEFCTSEAGLSVVRGWCEDRTVVDGHLNGFGAAVVKQGAFSSGEPERICPGEVRTKDEG